MEVNSSAYNFYTIPITPLSSIENRVLENDFDINNPVNFDDDHRLDQDTLVNYIESMKLLGLDNSADKITIEKLKSIKKRIYDDFMRLSGILCNMNLPSIDNILFVTIGNSMESYGYMLKTVFTQYKFGHIKVSRTLKDNIENNNGKENRIQLFNKYFDQKITKLIQKFESVNAVIILDTFGAGETMSTILHPFIKTGCKERPDLVIFPACLLEGGFTKPTPPYDENIRIVHLIESEDYLKSLNNFRNTSNRISIMPVLTFNEYVPLQQVQDVLMTSETVSKHDINQSLLGRFGQKKLKIFLETQSVELKSKGKFIVIPSDTTRLLSHINPYYPTAQKTVFIAEAKQNGKFITRDGHGFSRKEKPPMILHRLNNDLSFSKLPIISKIK